MGVRIWENRGREVVWVLKRDFLSFSGLKKNRECRNVLTVVIVNRLSPSLIRFS